MSDAFDDRRKGLEEEYFHRKNQELIEKLREKIKVSEAAKAASTSAMECPRCHGALRESKVDDVSIDVCEKCGGVWLDSGELEQLTKRESSGFFGRLWGKT
jgi:hypothetical protein